MKFSKLLIILLAFIFVSCGFSADKAISESHGSGYSLATSFGEDGILRHFFSGEGDSTSAVVIKALPLNSGKLLVLANTKSTALGERVSVSRWSADGTSLDATFAATESTPGIIEFDIGTVRTGAADMILQADGKILVSGGINNTLTNESDESFVLRLSADGALDGTFGTAGIFRNDFGKDFSQASGLAIDASGRILLTGWTSDDQTTFQVVIARLSSAGILDNSFDTDGYRIIDYSVSPDLNADNANAIGVVETASGTILIGVSGFENSSFKNSAIVTRFNSDGSFDTTFATNGHIQLQNNNVLIPTSMFLDENQRLILLADTTDTTEMEALSAVLRVSSSGALDTTFGTDSGMTILTPPSNSSAYAGDILMTSSGHIAVAGLYYGAAAGQGRLFLHLLSEAGKPISTINSGESYSFDTISNYDEFVYSLTEDVIGNLYITGREQPVGPTSQSGFILKLNNL